MSKQKQSSPSDDLLRRGVAAAFKAVSSGYSADRVIADINLNAQFLKSCSALGLECADTRLNQCLLNLRKASVLADFKCAKRTNIRNQEEYSFGSEIAVRIIERRRLVSLDQVLCDPVLALEFDEIASRIAPGYSSLEYRWAALCLRKTSRLKPELLGRVVRAEVVGPIPVRGLDVASLPIAQGLYIFASKERVLYVGEATNLRNRLKKHIDHSDNKFLAQYLWEFGAKGVILEYHVLPESIPTRIRKAMELELIRSRRAEYNVQR